MSAGGQGERAVAAVKRFREALANPRDTAILPLAPLAEQTAVSAAARVHAPVGKFAENFARKFLKTLDKAK